MFQRFLRLLQSPKRAPYNLTEQARSSWVVRAETAAASIRAVVDANGPVSVADLGCGDGKLRTALEPLIGDRLQYKGFDILPQSPAVERIDLEHESVPGRHTVITLLGVSEYVTDMSKLLGRVAQSARFLCVSYTSSDSGSFDAAQVAERQWKHHHSKREVDAFARALGFRERSFTFLDDGKVGLWVWEMDPKAGDDSSRP